jgi:hypothetical protein
MSETLAWRIKPQKTTDKGGIGSFEVLECGKRKRTRDGTSKERTGGLFIPRKSQPQAFRIMRIG